MPDFRTTFPPTPSKVKLTHYDHILCIGSCFSQEIGQKIANYKFKTLINPQGIVFNPMSIADTLSSLEQGRTFGEKDIFENAGLWRSWQHHSQFAKTDPNQSLEGMNLAAHEAAVFLKKTNRLFLTFGTSIVYEHKITGEIVANAHKMPADTFVKRFLTITEITEKLQGILQLLKENNPDLEVILTLSPIRHLRDGFVENQRSKAILLTATHQLVENYDFIHYFPAYELLLDDLRDYRFYEADMIHPNAVAVDYIWDFFKQTYVDAPTLQVFPALDKLRAAMLHRPFNGDSREYLVFKEQQRLILKGLMERYPLIDFSAEIAFFS
jgi:hypothetical protein